MRFKTLVVLLALPILSAGCNRDTTHAGGSGDAAATGGTPGGSAAGSGMGTGASGRGTPFQADVVAVEADGTGLTLREIAGGREQRLVHVDPTTATTVAALKPGDKVMVTCDSGSGSGSASGSAGSASTAGGAGMSGGSLQNCATVIAATPDTSR